MEWNHNEQTLDGLPIYKPGTLVRIDLEQHMLIDSDRVEIDPNTWISTDHYIAEYGPRPVVMVLNIDPLDNYYQISLGEKLFWFPLIYTDKVVD